MSALMVGIHAGIIGSSRFSSRFSFYGQRCCQSRLYVASNAHNRSDLPLPFLGSAWCCDSTFSSAKYRWNRFARTRSVWLFALGWAAARATRVSHRLLLTVAAVCGAMLPGFFDEDEGRKLVILGGLLLLVWVTRVPMLVALRRLTALLAGASLWIYLTQFQTYRFLGWGESLFDGPSAASGSGSAPAPLGLAPRVCAGPLQRSSPLRSVFSLGRHTSALSRTSLDSGREGPPSADREWPL